MTLVLTAAGLLLLAETLDIEGFGFFYNIYFVMYVISTMVKIYKIFILLTSIIIKRDMKILTKKLYLKL